MTAVAAHYFDPRSLAAIGSLELRARMIVEGMMTGMHRSPYHGLSVEFAQHRQYAPGDDLRHLDWKVFARTDKLYLKQHQKETNLDLLLLVDASGSMSFSSGFAPSTTGAADLVWRKFDHAAAISAALAYLALQQQDRVGMVLFDDRISHMVRPSNANDHWRSLIEALSSPTLGAAKAVSDPSHISSPRITDLGRLFDQVAAQLHQRSLIVLISDLFDEPAAVERGLARLRHARHDVILLQTLDPAERTFPFRDPSEFFGLEGEGRLNLDPPALRQAYLEVFTQHQKQLQEIARRFQFDFCEMDTSESVGGPLSKVLAKRQSMLTRGPQR